MDKDFMQGLGSFAAAIIGLATLSVVLSQRSATASVIGAAGQSFAGILGAATAPVTGSGGVGNNGATSGANILASAQTATGFLGQLQSMYGQSGVSNDPFAGAGVSDNSW